MQFSFSSVIFLMLCSVRIIAAAAAHCAERRVYKKYARSRYTLPQGRGFFLRRNKNIGRV